MVTISQSSEQPGAGFRKSTSLCHTVSLILLLLVYQMIALVTAKVLYVLFAYIEINQYILWHGVLLMLAFIPLMSGGILCFASSSVWLKGIKRSTRYYIHGAFLFSALIFMTVGICLEIYSRFQVGKLHFQTNHSITGLVSWILAFISCILGLTSFYNQRLKNFIQPVYLKLLHNFFALASFSIGIAGLCLGLEKKSYAHHVTEIQLSATLWVVGVIGTFTALFALRSALGHVKAIYRIAIA